MKLPYAIIGAPFAARDPSTMTLPNELPRTPEPPPAGVFRLFALFSSLLRAGRRKARAGRSALQEELAKVQFERMGFWLAAPNVLNASGVPLIGFPICNGSSLLISRVDVDAELYLEQKKSPAAAGLVRLRFDRGNGLAPGGPFSGIATMLMLENDGWASPSVRSASARRVSLRLRTAYDGDGNPFETA